MWWIKGFCGLLFCLTATATFAETAFMPETTPVVTVMDLPDLSRNTLGTIPATRADLWATSNPQALLDGLTRLGQVTLTPALQKTADFLLRADTTAAPFSDVEDIFGADGFLAARAQAALDLGLFETALDLVDLVPVDYQSERLRQIKVNALLLSGDTQKACALIDGSDMGIFGDKVRISCFLAHEEKNKAVLAFALYAENPDDDVLFQLLGNAVLNELPVDLPTDFVMAPHHVYLMSLYKGAPLDVLQKQSAGIRFALTDLPTTSIETRVTLGETLALTAEQAERLYKLPLFDLPIDTGALSRADLYQKIKAEVNPRTRAALLTQWFDSARGTPAAIRTYPFQYHLISDILPATEDIALAPYGVALAALYGNETAADDWMQILTDASDTKDRLAAVWVRPILAAAFDKRLPDEREIGLLNDACHRLKSVECMAFWAHLPMEKQLKKPDFIGDIPMTDTETIQTLFDDGKIGEGMIEVIIALADSEQYDASLIRFLTEGATGWNGDKVRLERMAYY